MEREIVFSFRTRGDSSPKGKPRVYFTCHPADLEEYLKKVCGDIFKTQDCAVYFTEDMSAELTNENNLADLGRMNLFVIPVTRRLLTEKNRAADHDLPFALERHIPVLPIMMEPGLDALYSRPDRFGDLQYVNPYSYDASEISYDEKLKKYLASVLISDELASRVRKAFDAYIFLSYRKTDRAHANELMRLIHAQPEFRDIAIWFDEFLTPGESFQENIQRILESSELFALLVTPNLLEKPGGRPNYVMGEEYPAAMRLGKPVFPAEMEKTDPHALREYFRNIPSPVDIRSDAEFRSRLIETLNRAAIAENNADPEHNFLIGLAYLDGIDVEVNVERAAELITGAAEKNYIPAAKKLVSMYSAGYGVKTDIDKAVKWQQRIVDLLEDKAEDLMTEASAFELLEEGYELGELALSVEDFETAKRAYTGSFEVAKRLCFGAIGKNFFSKAKVLFKKYVLNKSFYNEAVIYLIKASRKLVELAFSFGTDSEITEWPQKSMLLIRSVNAQFESADTAVELLALSGRMADECAASGNIGGARSWLELGANCWEGLSDDEKTREVRLAYARLLKAKSEFLILLDDYNSAYDVQDDRIDLLYAVYSETPEDYSVRYEMIGCYLTQADYCVICHAFDTAEQLMTRADKCIKHEMEQDNYLVQALLARFLFIRGRAEYEKKNYEKAAELLEKSCAVLRPVAEEKLDAEHQRRLEEAMELAGDAYVFMRDFAKAAEWHKKAEDVLAGLVSISKQVRDIRALARVDERLLDDSILTGHSTAITAYYERALWMLRALTEGIQMKNGLSSKSVAELAAGGDPDYAQYREDLKTLERLRGRGEEVRRAAAECAPAEDRLIDRLVSAPVDFSALFKGMAEVAKEVLRTHMIVDIRQDVQYLSHALSTIDSAEDLLSDQRISPVQLVRSAKKICDYVIAKYEPFFKFDENCMLLLAFSAALYGSLSVRAALSKDGTAAIKGFKFGNIVFMQYPVSEIAHEDLWRHIGNWLRPAR